MKFSFSQSLIGAAIVVALSTAATAQTPVRSPRNQVYQFMAKGPASIAAYLWIPEGCQKLRGLLIFAQNVPEGLIAGHSAIRKACADNDLGIVYTSTGFWHGKMESFGDTALKQPGDTQCLQDMLGELAAKSGYDEVATVPWLPIGESMSLLMVKGLVTEKPERCIAGIFACDAAYHAERTVPILGLQGTGGEWTQTKSDIRAAWRNTGNFQRVCELRKESPNWPVSLMVDPCGGHFTCSETMLRYMANYIDRVAKARLSDDGSANLKPVDTSKGFLASLPLAGKTATPIEPALGATDTARPWFFDRADAEQAQAIAKVNWDAATQLPIVLAGDHAVVHPWAANSVTTVEVKTSGEFSLKPILLDGIPNEFVAAGQALAKSPKTPAIEWVSGVVAPLGDNRFCVELDRNYKDRIATAVCLAVVAEGTSEIRKSVQPLLINIAENIGGVAQTIDFKKLGDMPVGTQSLPLEAKANSGLPVKFYIEAGPAIVENNRLVFTKLPPKTKFPIEVIVVAWQWGTCEPPLVNKAIARQTFWIVK